MLIFGYGPRRPRDLGPVAPARCPACGNQVEFHLLQQRSWVSLFFVPVIPTGARHLLVCPICQHAVGLDTHQGRLAHGLASARADHLAGRLDDDAYRAQVDAFWRAAGATRDDEAPRDEPGPGPGGDTWWPGAGGPGGSGAPPPGAASGGAGGWPSAGHPSQQPGAGAGPPEPGPSAPPPDPASRRPDPDPGWYPDPFDEADERYWDGTRWTQGTKPPRV